MKRCPECRRDYYDDTLLYCLDDGNALLEGPASADEAGPVTLPLLVPRVEGDSKAALTLNKTAILQAPTTYDGRKLLFKKHPKFVVAIVLLVFAAGGFLVYRYFRVPNGGQINSIAVLPFQNKSGDPNFEYLSDGLSESLIYRLSQLPDLIVSPTSSVVRYKGKETDTARIASELGVDAIVTGHLTQIGDKLGISVELVDVGHTRTLWGEQYERNMSDLLATQREIAAEITNNLRLKLSGEGKNALVKAYTNNNDAYQSYLKGRYHFAKRTPEDMQRSLEYFREATTLDTRFALAYVAISDCQITMALNGHKEPREAIPQAKNAVRQALDIDPVLAEAHASNAFILLSDWNWAEAEKEFKRAIELNPNVADTHFRYGLSFLLPFGLTDEAIAEVKRASELDPTSQIIGANLARAYLYAGQNNNGLEQAKNSYNLDPNHAAAAAWLGIAYQMNGMYAESLELMNRHLKGNPDNKDFLFVCGMSYAKVGRQTDSLEIVRRLREIAKTQYVKPTAFAYIYSALGDKQNAFIELEKALDEGDFNLAFLKVDPSFSVLRGDPRLDDLLRRISLLK